MNQRRKCLYDGRKAWFHKWSYGDMGDENGKQPVAIIEFEQTGRCTFVEVYEIKFTDEYWDEPQLEPEKVRFKRRPRPVE